MTQHYFVPSEGVLGLQANVRDLRWSWGVNMPEREKEDFEQCTVKVRLVAEDEVQRDPHSTHRLEDFGKFHYFSGVPGGDSVYYERALFGRRRLQMRIDGLVAGEPVVHVNRDYLRFVTHRFMNLHSIGYILTDLVALQLLRNGYVPLHCSGFTTEDATVLVLAAPNTGKTLAAMTACIEHGSGFLAEDLAISDGESLYSVPWTSTFRYYDQIDGGPAARAMNRLTELLPPLELLRSKTPPSIETYVPPERILDSSNITHVALLERGAESIQPADFNQALRKAETLNRYEFNYMKAPALVAYEYFNPELDLGAALKAESDKIEAVLRGANEVLIARTNDASRYASLIIDHVK